MYLLRVFKPSENLEFALRETDINKIQIRQAAESCIIAAAQEYYSVPVDAVWTLSSGQSAPKSSIEVLKESTDLEELEVLTMLLREGLDAEPTPFKRVGAAKALLQKLQKVITEKKKEESTDA